MIRLLLKIAFLIFFIQSCQNQKETLDNGLVKDSAQRILAFDLPVEPNGLSQLEAVIKTVHGNVSIKFYPKKAPNTVTRLIELVQTGFYDGLLFHKVIPKFIVQTGDPTRSGDGGSGKKLMAEFNDLQHIFGTVAMARGEELDSADSQFYIALATLPHLDGKYTVIGQVVVGLDILVKINQGDKILSMTIENMNQ